METSETLYLMKFKHEEVIELRRYKGSEKLKFDVCKIFNFFPFFLPNL